MDWPFAVWLCPAEPAHSLLQATIEALSARHQAPQFPVHMTLFSGHYRRISTLRAKFHTAADALAPLDLEVLGIAKSEQFFRTLYLRLSHPPELEHACAQLRQALDPESHYELRPHVSMLYKRTDEPEREQLQTDVDLGLTAIPFDTLVLATPAEGHHDWTDIPAWRIQGRVLMHSLVD